jgi:hypothetical protein
MARHTAYTLCLRGVLSDSFLAGNGLKQLHVHRRMMAAYLALRRVLRRQQL